MHISSYKMEQFEEEMRYIEYGEFNWSMQEWEKARSGDNFYLVKVGEGRTGIVMKGFFTSAPYEAADWSDGIDIRSGENKYGTLLFYRDGNRIKTEGKYGKVVFTVEGSIPLPILIWISVID